MEYKKVHSAQKDIVVKGKQLESTVLKTMKTISDIVGATLGPGGQPVLIERFEHGLPVTITKDGVTVFRSLGFKDPSQQCIMEAARDAAIRTASEAGDGTTTATILAEAIVRNISDYCKTNPRVSPQRVVRRLEDVFKTYIEPTILQHAIKADLTTDSGRALLHSVAKVSANGDTALADAVLECFDVCGDEGNVTISELSGSSRYEVEKVDGYPIPMGYEESCAKFYPKFINDPATQRCVLENPVFICYHGNITEIQSIVMLLDSVGREWERTKYPHNVVLLATGFSEQVLGDLAFNFVQKNTINVFPLLMPRSAIANGQLQLLEDICAITNGNLFDRMNKPLSSANIAEFGNVLFNEESGEWENQGVSLFECSRFRCTIIGHADEEALLRRIDDVKKLISMPDTSELDAYSLKERIAKLSGGIARLKVIGSSNGELKEKRDRAEDAVCAVRGAIKHGCLPGGGWMLINLVENMAFDEIANNILAPALMAPVSRLFLNIGINEEEQVDIVSSILLSMEDKRPLVYDLLESKFVDPADGGVLDSVPAVLEAVRNSISIASLLGTLGGTVVFSRDEALELNEAAATQQFMRDSTMPSFNEANNRP